MESFITGRELTIGVLQNDRQLRALPPSEAKVETGHSFDYEGKYLGRGTIEVTPADLTDHERGISQEMAVEAHRALRCYGYTRTDMILTAQGPVYLETNTLPGLTRASFIPQQLAAAQLSMTSFVEEQLNAARNRSGDAKR
jgi:D-alanine-D-alanine ligase